MTLEEVDGSADWVLQPLLPAIPYEVTNDARGQVEVAFVFSQITQLMKLGEHTPHLWARPSVWESTWKTM